MISEHTPPHLHRVRRGCAAIAGVMALALVAGCGPGAEDQARAKPVSAPSVSADSGTPVEAPAEEEPTADEAPADEAGEAQSEGEEPAEPESDPETQTAALGQGAVPERVEIPGIDVAEDLIDLGLQDDGTMEVPADWDRAGWFTGGSRPGGPGATVIAGHVDSPTGPAVFFRLTELDVGDRVEITDADGAAHHYEVYRLEDLPKDDYPTHLVFGATPHDELRLVTCTGEFDGAAQRHLDNRVVFARAVEG